MNRSHVFTLLIPFCILIASPLASQPWKEYGKLTVLKQNPHYISHADSTTFFWFGDTAWELFHRLNREEAEKYLQDRKEKGFNVIQAVAISEFHHQKPTNFYGDSLFRRNDPLRPLITSGSNPSKPIEYDYWDHVDYIIGLAEKKGLFVALLPTWGEWVIPRQQSALFNSQEQAYKYGWFLSNRLKKYPNIIWMLGGDRHPDERKGGVDIWRSMAEGINDAAGSNSTADGKSNYESTFMTHHSYESSSKWFHQDPWIDFHAWGSYHSDYYSPRSYQQTEHDRKLPAPKPTINSEPNYEGHPVNYAIAGNGVFTEVDVRIAAYWTLFSGAAGFTYGAHAIWQFADSTRPAYSTLTFEPWQQAMEFAGSSQMIHLKRLLESNSLKGLFPDQSMIGAGQGHGADYIPVLRDSTHAFFYIPTGKPITVKFGVMTGRQVNASWFDPRTGKLSPIGTFENSGSRQFEVPGRSETLQWLRSGRGCDWVLVLDTRG